MTKHQNSSATSFEAKILVMWKSTWREEKEAFVSGLTGSSHVMDVVRVTMLPSMLVVVYWCVMSVCPHARGYNQYYMVLGRLVEFLVIVVPLIVQLTREDHVMGFMAAGIAAVWGGMRMWRYRHGEVVNLNVEHFEAWRSESVKMIQDAVSLHRANVMLMTCLAILAVDFRVFPRSYAKTEVYGTSLMDAGVGSIVLCSSYVEGVKQMQSTRYRQGSGKKLKEASFSSVMRVAMLVLLGVARPMVLVLIGYQVHVGEYGMHWNFFLTLAVLRACISNVPRSTSPFALGMVLLCAHQYGLSRLGLADLANAQSSLEERRTMNVLYQNKEGIISLPGYLALHFLGVWCAKFHIWLTSKPRFVGMRGWNVLQVVFVGFLWVAYWFASTYIGPASRRTCNPTFVLWMLAINLLAIVVNTVCLNLVSLDTTRIRVTSNTQEQQGRIASPYIPPLLNSMNKGMLYVFLLSNVLTGIVNSMIDTLQVDDMMARGILLAYMGLVYMLTRYLFT